MQLSEIFHAATALPASARSAYLEQACGTNLPLRREVESLLQAHENPAPFPRNPVERTSEYLSVTERPGMQIGPYILREEIGEGGFGLVFVAEQQHPVRRKVALKLIKPGMDTRTVIARFEAERQALAMMDHPNIAKVFDAGSTESGRPFFVMELVKGTPITEYADANSLSTRQRLELFVQVCQAVQHAHQKGVIHRDLKPNNILVAPHDGLPVVKVIDFGVAKALGQQLTEKTIYTQFAAMIGTPLYMSPEQAEVNQLDVDTRSDIYSLGVLLYELLTGTTPIERERLKKAAFDEIRRIIKEEEPPRPSNRLTSLGATLTSAAAQRGTEPAKLTNLVRGELDWIVMRCLEKDRSRRYETATGLAKDIQRYLAGDAVEACPPTLGYRLRKLYLRNRTAVLIGGAFAAVLLIATGVSIAFGISARQSERNAIMQEEAARERAREAAKSAEDARNATNDREMAISYLSRVLAQFNPFRHSDGNPSIRKVLEAACTSLDKTVSSGEGERPLTPIVRAKVRGVFGRMYMDIHEYDKGHAQLKKAFEELEQLNGPKHLDSLKAKEDYAYALVESRFRQKDLKEAEEILKKSHQIRTDVQGPWNPATLNTHRLLEQAIFFQSDDPFPRIVELERKALDAALNNPALGEDHLITADIRFRLARILGRSGDKINLDDAHRLVQQTLETYERTPSYGPDHPNTILVRTRQAILRYESTKPDELPKSLIKYIDDLVRACKTENDIRVLMAYGDCALFSTLVGKVEISRECTAKLLELTPKLRGERHPDMRLAYSLRGWYYVLAGEYERAEVELKKVFSADFSKLDGEYEGGWDVNAPRSAYMLLAQCLLHRPTLTEADFRKAEEYLEKAELLEAKAPKHLGKLGWSRVLLNTQRWEQRVRLYTLWKKPDEAAKWQKKIDEVMQK